VPTTTWSGCIARDPVGPPDPAFTNQGQSPGPQSRPARRPHPDTRGSGSLLPDGGSRAPRRRSRRYGIPRPFCGLVMAAGRRWLGTTGARRWWAVSTISRGIDPVEIDRTAAARQPRPRAALPDVVRKGSAPPQARGPVSAATGCAERMIRRSPAVGHSVDGGQRNSRQSTCPMSPKADFYPGRGLIARRTGRLPIPFHAKHRAVAATAV